MFGGSGALSVSAGITLVFIFGAILPNWRWVCIGKCFTYVTKTIANSGLPKAEIFGRNRIFSLFGFRFRPPKFYSRYSAFGFVFKMSWYTYPFLIKAHENLPKL